MSGPRGARTGQAWTTSTEERVTVGDRCDVAIHGVAAGGEGVGTAPDGRTLFVHRTAPGDRCTVEVTDSRSRWARGKLIALRSAGPRRREPPCPLYERCGGCSLQHLDYGEQLEWKARILTEALARIGGIDDADIREVVPSPRRFHYRSRLTFHLRRLGSGRVVAGFHRLDRPGRIVDVVDQCLLGRPELIALWARVRAAWGAGARRLPRCRALRLTLRTEGDGAILLIEPDERPRRTKSSASEGVLNRSGAAKVVTAVGDLGGIWWRHDPFETPIPLARGRPPRSPPHGVEEVDRVGAFEQVNAEVGAALAESVVAPLVAEGVSGRRVVDAYCGTAVYGRALARAGAYVVGIEADPGAARVARHSAPPGLEIETGRVEDILAETLPADVVILNPPRSGLGPSIPALLVEAAPERLVYVSCDPATLARDLRGLSDRFEIEECRAFDLFPQTAHLEAVVRLVAREEVDADHPV